MRENQKGEIGYRVVTRVEGPGLFRHLSPKLKNWLFESATSGVLVCLEDALLVRKMVREYCQGNLDFFKMETLIELKGRQN